MKTVKLTIELPEDDYDFLHKFLRGLDVNSTPDFPTFTESHLLEIAVKTVKVCSGMGEQRVLPNLLNPYNIALAVFWDNHPELRKGKK